MVNDEIYDNPSDMGVDFSVGVFDIDVKHRNKPLNTDLILNVDKLPINDIIVLITCIKNHEGDYFNTLNNFKSNPKLTHQSVLSGFTTAENYNYNCRNWKHYNHKYILDYHKVLPVDDLIKLMIIESLKEEVR